MHSIPDTLLRGKWNGQGGLKEFLQVLAVALVGVAAVLAQGVQDGVVV